MVRMKIRLLKSLEIVGVLLLLFGILLGFIGADVLHISFDRMDLVPIAFGFCGILLFIVCRYAIGYEKNKTNEQQIEEKDERMIMIYQKSKSKAFDLIAILLPFGLLALAMFGYMHKVSFFILTGIYLLCIIYFNYQLLINKKKM